MSSNPPATSDEPPAEHSKAPSTGGDSATTTTPAKRTEPAVGFTRAGALWSALIAGFLILIVLLIFITQNTASAELTFLGWHWSLPLGVAILLAAVVGGLLTVAVGTARILQLRRAAKKHAAAATRPV